MTKISVLDVYEYLDSTTGHSVYLFKQDAGRRSWGAHYKKVSDTPVYAVLEEEKNDFLNPVLKLLGVHETELAAKAAARLLQ